MKFKRTIGLPLPPEDALAITVTCHELYMRWRTRSPRLALRMRLASLVLHDRVLTGVRVSKCE
jgi:hypothetical protein